MKVRLPFFTLFLCTFAFGYPEITRHGYTNCMACHFSPNGGGILTPYGRSLSQEIVSSWPANSNFLMSVEPTETLSLGGQLRVLQSHMSTSTFTKGRTIFMQADLEAALSFDEGKWVLSGTLGKGDTSSPPGLDFLLSRRHYVNYKPNDQLSFRAGRFFPAFGLTTPDHMIATKRQIDWDYDQETYNIEGAYFTDTWDIFATAILGRFDRPSLTREKGFALRASKALHEKHRFGLSYYYGSSSAQQKHLAGPFAMLGFSKKFYLLAEIDLVNRTLAGSTSQTGMVNYLRVFYQPVQGLQFYLTQELSKVSLSTKVGDTELYGIGAQFFPFPHVELHLQYSKQAINHGRMFDFAFLLAHIYL